MLEPSPFMSLPGTNEDSALELRVKLAQKEAKISTLEQTNQIVQEAMVALRKELATLRENNVDKNSTKKLESKVEKLTARLKEKDHTIATLNLELENKSLHVVELASELRAVEEEMILRSSAHGKLDSLEDESMPSIAQDSIQLRKKKKKKSPLASIADQ